MKIARIRMQGFRGVRVALDLELPGGFVIVSGRNGTGKSTICDAIEYALTGKIRASSDHVEKGEGLADYIWWRGPAERGERFVEVTLVGDEGSLHLIRRTPTSLEVPKDFDLEGALCGLRSNVTHPLVELCRTAILRDEDITRLSVDLKETDRFEFVRAALGTADFSAAEAKAKDVQERVTIELRNHETQYAVANDRIASVAARLSQARTQVTAADGLPAAEALLRAFVSESSPTLQGLVRHSEQRLADLRITTDRLTRCYSKLQDLHKRQQQIQAEAHRQEIARLQTALDSARSQTLVLESEHADLVRQTKEAQLSAPQQTSQALLREHGSRLGLVDGCCPLCGSAQTEEHYRTHLVALEESLRASGQTQASLIKREADTALRLASSRSQVSQLTRQLESAAGTGTELLRDIESLKLEAGSLGVILTDDVSAGTIALALTIEEQRKRMSDLERAIAIVHASQTVEQITGMEQELKTEREALTALEQRLSKLRTAINQTKEASATIRRTQGEFVNEQLAQLEPLMLELYQRLRPHIDWPEVRYRLRGDVRRLLSLEIGDGLNPSFVFSSGQRRAAGLAFLLALHLSRSWCTLKTLILDDPVQHIDDYRALHLTEVLAAVRRTGRQVICTVEDESLGQLLVRRLRCDAEEGGLLLRMAYSSKLGVHVARASPVHPLMSGVLVPA